MGIRDDKVSHFAASGALTVPMARREASDGMSDACGVGLCRLVRPGRRGVLQNRTFGTECGLDWGLWRVLRSHLQVHFLARC
jgi:hypothetical protein